MAPFSAAFGLVLAFVAYMILETEGSIALSGIVFAMGGAMVYWGVAGWFNRTVIRVSPERIVLQTGPLPAFGNSSVATQDVASIDLRVSVSSTGKGGTSTSCSIWTKQADGNEAKLSRGFLTATWLREDAEFIHRELEAALGEVRPE